MKLKAKLLLAFSVFGLVAFGFEMNSSIGAISSTMMTQAHFESSPAEAQKVSVKAKNRRAGRSPAIDASATIVADAAMIHGEALARAYPSSI